MPAYNEYTGFLEDNPEILYRGMAPQKASPNFLNWYNNQYGNVFGNWFGSLGRQALGGQAPTLSFFDYMNQGKNPAYEDWWSMSPRQRGEYVPNRMSWNMGR